METLQIVLAIATKFGAVGTVLAVGYLVFERLVEKGYLKIGKQDDTNAENDPKEKETVDISSALKTLMDSIDGIGNGQKELSVYFNHETTGILKEIRDELKTGFSDMRAKHKEYDVIGIPTRDCKK